MVLKIKLFTGLLLVLNRQDFVVVLIYFTVITLQNFSKIEKAFDSNDFRILKIPRG